MKNEKIKIETQKIVILNELLSIEDTFLLKECINLFSKNNNNTIVLEFKNLLIMPSSIVGLLLKYLYVDKYEIILIVYKKKLYESLVSLKLNDIFFIKLVQEDTME